jgi:2,4-dienoyl-CoA reductase-like NADH-dependent reductase (Old Yellow Enzyme family)
VKIMESIIFSPQKIGNLELRNRIIRSATYENMAKSTGECSDSLINLYDNLASGEIGLIITGHFYVHKSGRGGIKQVGIHNDEMIPGLSRLTKAVHEKGGKLIFQLSHAGRQTTKSITGDAPIAPSSKNRDMMYLVKPKRMDEAEIETTIDSFVEAAERAVQSNADGIQLHAAHGYLINEFLSPFFNSRNDRWGGSEENQFRFLKEIILRIRKRIPSTFPLLVKINGHDYTPKKGITPQLAIKYTKWLSELDINAIEVSCGTTLFSGLNSARGDVPVKEFMGGLQWWKKPFAWYMLRRMVGKYALIEGYNLKFAKMIQEVIKETPLILVGGIRTKNYMEDLLNNHKIDFIAMARPFIREPTLVKRLKEGKLNQVSCISCNRCIAAFLHDLPLACYVNGIPKQKKLL